MNTQSKPARTKATRGIYLNLDDRTKARVEKRAEANNLKLGPYSAMALRHYMDAEEAFGGPIPEQFRAQLIRNVAGWAKKMREITG